MELLLLLAIAGILTASIRVWLTVVARWRQGLPALAAEPRRMTPWTLADLAMTIVAYLAMYVLLARLLLGRMEAGEEPSLANTSAALAITSLTNLVATAFSIAWIRHRTGAAWSDLGLRFDRILEDLRIGLATFAAVSVPVYALQALLSQLVKEQHPIVELLKRHQQPWVLVLSGLSAVVVAPLTEEFFFRVLLQGWFESLAPAAPIADGSSTPSESVTELVDSPGRMLVDPGNPYSASISTATDLDAHGEQALAASRRQSKVQGTRWGYFAIIASSLIFSLMHLGHGAAPIPLFFLALALGYLYQQTGRLLPSVIVHFCLNAASLIALWVSVAFGIE